MVRVDVALVGEDPVLEQRGREGGAGAVQGAGRAVGVALVRGVARGSGGGVSVDVLGGGVAGGAVAAGCGEQGDGHQDAGGRAGEAAHRGAYSCGVRVCDLYDGDGKPHGWTGSRRQ